MIKYNSPETTGLAPIHKDKISVNALKIPPKACPAFIAVIYFEENFPAIPHKLPPKIAAAAKIQVFVEN